MLRGLAIETIAVKTPRLARRTAEKVSDLYTRVRPFECVSVLDSDQRLLGPVKTVNGAADPRALATRDIVHPGVMEIYYSNEDRLSEDANQLVGFDVDSVRQVVAAERGTEPDIWLVAPDGYQAKGHLLRDSESIRLIAYSRSTRVVYATDGCNSCRHMLDTPLEAIKEDEFETLSKKTQLPMNLLQRLAQILRG